MGFLFISCINPMTDFLGIIPLYYLMIIISIISILIGFHNYIESTICFDNVKIFELFDHLTNLIMEIIVSIFLFLAFFIKKKYYISPLYLITLFRACFSLTINIYKLAYFHPNIEEHSENYFVKWLYFIRIMDEFFVEIIICYTVYSFKKSLV